MFRVAAVSASPVAKRFLMKDGIATHTINIEKRAELGPTAKSRFKGW